MPEDRNGYEMVPSVIGVNSWADFLSTRKDLLFFCNHGLGKQDAEDFDNVRHELGGPDRLRDLEGIGVS